MAWRLERDISGFLVRRSAQAQAQYRQQGYWTDETLADLARRQVEADPEQILLIEGEQELTRGQVWDQALRLCGFFGSVGLKSGDVVSFQLPNWVEAAVIALAARMWGLVINPIPPIYREAELRHILSDCGSRMIFIPGVFRGMDYPAMLERLRPSLPNLQWVVPVRSESVAPLCFTEAVAGPGAGQLPQLDASAVMMVMYTSGTTSQPKGVLHSHQTYGFKVRQMAQTWSITQSDRFFMPSPLTHITGAFWSFDMPWLHGGSSVLMDAWSAPEAIRIIERWRCTFSGGATPFLQQLLDAAGETGQAAASLRYFFCGGTTVPAELVRRAGALLPNCIISRAYGSTETPTISSLRDPTRRDLGAETDGEITPPAEVRIVRSDGSEAAPGEEGEILTRGPEQFLGYLNIDNPEDFDAEGWFATGDLGRRVHGDYLVITGRKKDIIIRSGENISPKEVEDALLDHPGIVDVAIVAMPSPRTGEAGCAFVVPRDDRVVDLEDIRSFLGSVGLARQKCPEHLVLVDDLPRVPSGKVRKDVLRARAAAMAAQIAAA